MSNDNIIPENIIIPPYKGWGLVKKGIYSFHYHHFVGRPEHDGSTCNLVERKGWNCRMCNITMPEEVLTYLQRVWKFIKIKDGYNVK